MAELQVPPSMVSEAGFDERPEFKWSKGQNVAEEIKEALSSVGVSCRIGMKKREINRHAVDALFYNVKMEPETEQEKKACVVVAHLVDKSLVDVDWDEDTYCIYCGR